MRKLLLSLVALIALVSYSYGQTTYLDFEGATPTNGVFGGSDFSIVDNPDKTGVNTSDKVAMTMKSGTGIETWGGAYFPLGGTINFTPSDQTFTMDVYSDVAGTVTFKVENGEQGPVELPVDYTTPGVWQTLTFTFTDRAADYKQIVIFMGFGTVNEDVWYYDNVKGPGLTAGENVDVTYNLVDLGGVVTSAEMELSNAVGTKVALTGTAGAGSIWTKVLNGVAGSTIAAPITYNIYINGTLIPELSNQAFVAAGSTPTIITKNYGTAPAGVNVLTNGNFDDIDGVMVGRTDTEWGMWSDNGGVAEVIDGVVTVTAVVNEANNWAMQVEQYNFPLENDKTYTARFQAWADNDRVICLTIEDPANGYALLGTSENEGAYDIEGVTRSKWDLIVTTVPTFYELVLTVDQMQETSSTKFAFLLAQSAEVLYIDSVSLMEGNNVSVPVTKTSSVKVYPNPAVNELYIQGMAGHSNVVVYNVLGAQVKEYSRVSQSINVSDLKSGVYMIKFTSQDGKLVTSKFIKR